MSAEVLSSAERSLRILSGLYGALNPLSGIEAHRLEMGTKLATKKGKKTFINFGESR